MIEHRRAARSISQSREGHAPKLLGTAQRTQPLVAPISRDDAMEGLPREEIHHWANSVLPTYIEPSAKQKPEG